MVAFPSPNATEENPRMANPIMAFQILLRMAVEITLLFWPMS